MYRACQAYLTRLWSRYVGVPTHCLLLPEIMAIGNLESALASAASASAAAADDDLFMLLLLSLLRSSCFPLRMIECRPSLCWTWPSATGMTENPCSGWGWWQCHRFDHVQVVGGRGSGPLRLLTVESKQRRHFLWFKNKTLQNVCLVFCLAAWFLLYTFIYSSITSLIHYFV